MAGARLARAPADGALRPGALRPFPVSMRGHRHARNRPGVAVAAGSHLDAVYLRHLHRLRRRHAPQRPPLPHRARRIAARRRPQGRRDRHPARDARGGGVHDLVRLHQLHARLRQLPAAFEHADRVALRRDPARGRPGRALHRGADRERLAQRLRSQGARGGRRDGFVRPARRGAEAMSAPTILVLMSICFLAFGYLGVPVPFALMAGVFVGATLADVSLAGILQKVFDGMDNEALLAIPFFLLVGELMSSANVVQRIANLSLALVGHIRGGLSQVVTVFSMFFSEMSGSTTADVAVMSRALAPPMKREGYRGPFIAAIIAAASTIAALVPPSITAVVYGAVGNVSIAGLFMAGVVPGFMIGFGLMIF